MKKNEIKKNPYNIHISYLSPDMIKASLKEATFGNKNAQYQAGYIYKEGIKVIKNHIKSIRWFYLANFNGHDHANYAISCFPNELIKKALGKNYNNNIYSEKENLEMEKLFNENYKKWGKKYEKNKN